MVHPLSRSVSATSSRREDGFLSTASGREFDRFRPAIHAYLRRRGFSGEDVEDLTQETFVRAYLHRKEFHGTNLGGWLYRIAGNLAIDHRRRQQRTPVLSLDWAHLEPVDAASPEVLLLGRDDHAEVRLHLEALPPEQQELIRLRFQERRSVREIAECLHCTTGAAKLRLFRAVETLRKRCGEKP